jgi:hypothetical protein
MYTNNLFDLAVNIGLASIQYTEFEKYVKINPSDTILRIIDNPKKPTFFIDMQIIKDKSKIKKLLNMAKNGNFEKINRTSGFVELMNSKIAKSVNNFVEDVSTHSI